MNKKFKDPFGGVHGEAYANSPSPFKIDKEEALREIQESLEKWDQKKIVKKSFLQKQSEICFARSGLKLRKNTASFS